MLPKKPDEIVDRDEDWKILERFARPSPIGTPGSGVAALAGRRRTGKSYLLQRFADATGGFYFEARLEETLAEAQERFREELITYDPSRAAELSALSVAAHGTWDRLLKIAMDATFSRSEGNRIPPFVIDEFPYLLRDTPHLQSIVKSVYDTRSFRRGEIGKPGIWVGYYDRLIEGRMLLCGSAMSVIHELGHGSRPLFGRLTFQLTVDPFDHVDMARFWGIEDRRVAFTLFAALGGAPGYRDPLMERTGLPVPQTMEELDAWLTEALLRPQPRFFTEAEIDRLLHEDPRITDKDIYRQAMKAISEGNATLTKIGGAIGRAKEETDGIVARLVAMRYVDEWRDLLRPRDYLFRLNDPIVRFHHAVVESCMRDVARGATTPDDAWRDAQQRFRSQVIGPMFEQIATWSAFRLLYNRTDLGSDGWALVPDPANRTTHEVDYIGLAHNTSGRPKGSTITVIGETKATERPRGLKDLERLRHIRALLAKDHKAENAVLAIFSMHGFSEHLRQAAKEAPDEIALFDLDDVYRYREPSF
ncbi:AAA family ATPase [Microtetraspora malaysiensis]|uniref:AAA family ATPase n=1 Tax=Microtetraspora malaysiensis TaxID=161358 RepID=UPI003D90DF93